MEQNNGSDIIKAYYNRNSEFDRFDDAFGILEFERSKILISRNLPQNSVRILDVGGGTGAYSFWLAGLGHQVDMIDLSEGHVETAKKLNAEWAEKLCSINTGNVLALDFDDDSFDIVLNMGPMYHLVEKDKRNRALHEIKRVLKNGGIIISAFISRFASLIYKYKEKAIIDPRYAETAFQDIETGKRDGTDGDEYFTIAYFHKPEEIAPELEAVGFQDIDVRSVECIFYTFKHLDEFVDDKHQFAQMLAFCELLEQEPSVIGASAHLLSTAVKPK